MKYSFEILVKKIKEYLGNDLEKCPARFHEYMIMHKYLKEYPKKFREDILCEFATMFTNESFISFSAGISWPSKNVKNPGAVAKFFWAQDMYVPKSKYYNYHQILDICITTELQEKFYKEITKMEYEVIVHAGDLAVQDTRYEYFFYKFIEDTIFLENLSMWQNMACTLYSVRYFESIGFNDFDHRNLYGAIKKSNYDVIDYFLRNYTKILSARDFNSVVRSKKFDDIQEIYKIFIVHGIYYSAFREYVKGLVGFCAKYYVPGLEEVCPDVLQVMSYRKKMECIRYVLMKKWPSDLLIVIE